MKKVEKNAGLGINNLQMRSKHTMLNSDLKC